MGQALGAPLKNSEQHKAPKKKLSEAAAEPKPPSLCKTDSCEHGKANAELQTCSQSLHQPLQQIPVPQENMEQSTLQLVCPSTVTEGQLEPLSLVKTRRPACCPAVNITEVKQYECQGTVTVVLKITNTNEKIDLLTSARSCHRSRERCVRTADGTSTVGPNVLQLGGQLGRRRRCRSRSFHLQKTHHHFSEEQLSVRTPPFVIR